MGQLINVGPGQRSVWSGETDDGLGFFSQSQSGKSPGPEVAVQSAGCQAFAVSPPLLIPA